MSNRKERVMTENDLQFRGAIAGPLVLLLAVFGGCDLSEGPDIFEAAKQGNAEQVKNLLAKDSSLANARYEGGTYRQQTPLHFASTAMPTVLRECLHALETDAVT